MSPKPLTSPERPRRPLFAWLLTASLLAVAGLATAFSAAGISACESDTGCKDDFDCEGALVCKVSTGTCEAFVCADDLDCDNGLTCQDNACQ